LAGHDKKQQTMIDQQIEIPTMMHATGRGYGATKPFLV